MPGKIVMCLLVVDYAAERFDCMGICRIEDRNLLMHMAKHNGLDCDGGRRDRAPTQHSRQRPKDKSTETAKQIASAAISASPL